MNLDAKKTLRKVMERNGFTRSLLDINSYFAGSYEEMAQIADYARLHGWRFMYDPRELRIMTEWLGRYYWYCIYSDEGDIISEGFERYDDDYAFPGQLIYDLQSKWQKLDKPEPEHDQKILTDYLMVPRETVLTDEELRMMGASGRWLKRISGGYRVPADYMCRFHLVQEFPESFTRNGIRYELMSASGTKGRYRTQKGDVETVPLPFTYD